MTDSNNKLQNCECQEWARDDNGILLTNHHPNCKQYNPVGDALELIEELVKGIESWAADEDGVHDAVWDAYYKARMVLGRPIDTWSKSERL